MRDSNDSKDLNPQKCKFGSDELIILGSGGGRYHCKKQHRGTGGLVLRALNGNIQCHIDPGPGAITKINEIGIDAVKTNYIFLTHHHTDHSMSIPIIIESSQEDYKYKSPSGTLIAPPDYLERLEPYYKHLLETVIPVKEGRSYDLEQGFKISKTTHTHHGFVENYGYILEIGEPHKNYHYTIAFTSDTAEFPEYVKTYKGVDILVANILRPDDIKCGKHMTINEFIPLLKRIKPKICVLIHFGGYMDNPNNGDRVPEQIAKVQGAVGEQTRVVGGEDGLRIKFSAVLHETKEKKNSLE